MNICLRSLIYPSLAAPNHATASTNVVQKRFRYYWRKRPEARKRILMMQVAMPRLPKKQTVQSQAQVDTNVEKLHGIDVILEREAKEIFEKSPMVIACLYTQPAISDQYFHTRYELQGKGMNMTRIPAHVMDHVLSGSKYQNLSTLCQTQTALIYGETNLRDMMEIVKKNKYLCMLGGLYHDQLVTVEQLKRYSNLPSIEQLHGELLATLSTQLSSTYHLLQNPINKLGFTLEERKRNLESTDAD